MMMHDVGGISVLLVMRTGKRVCWVGVLVSLMIWYAHTVVTGSVHVLDVFKDDPKRVGRVDNAQTSSEGGVAGGLIVFVLRLTTTAPPITIVS